MLQELVTLGYEPLDAATQQLLQTCIVMENNPFKKGRRIEGRELVVSAASEVYSLVLATDLQEGTFIYASKYLGERA